MFSNAWSHKQKEPEIFTINNVLKVYQNVSDKIVRQVKKDGISVETDGNNIRIPNNKLLNEIMALVEEAKEKKDQEMVVVVNANDTMSIRFDNKNNLIFSLQLP
jgi:hypothetical protein